jgi:penicillin amidase
MNKPLRNWLIAAGSMLALIALIFVAILVVVRNPLPKTRGILAAKGLQSEVEVLRDRYGVPHIRAATMHDLYFAQGYVTAQDRFWQMDFWRRIGAGRLSELFGKSTLGTDMYLRTVGFRRVAQQDYLAMDPETKSVFESYAEGVNAYVGGRPPGKVSLEYTLLKLQGVPVSIEPWTSLDSITWLKLMAQDLSGNMRRELYSISLIQQLGLARMRDFFGTYRYGEMPVIVSDSELVKSLLRPGGSAFRGPGALGVPGVPGLPGAGPSPELLAALQGVPMRGVGGIALGAPLALGDAPGLGSNNWVIAGSRTASGKPILANDPHLGIQMPSIWYETDLYCSATEQQPGKNAGSPFHVRGFSFAGVPGVIVGHNDRIAWGVTNLNPDVQDLYIEKVNPENPNQYEVNGHWVDMGIHREEIKVLHQDEPTVILARETRHGPVITDSSGFAGYRGFTINPSGAFPMSLELRVLSLKWTALQANSTFHSLVLLDRARNFEEFRQALRYWDVPSQNFVYADVDGNIGYQAPGLVPIRGKGDGTVPSPGWTDEFEWKGFIPFENLPFSYNPPKGYIVTANNPVTSPSYRYFISADYDLGYRARRITELIEGARGKISVAEVESIQADTLNLSAREVIPFLKPLTLEGDAAKGRDILAGWDMRMDPQSAGAAVYAYFWQALVEEVFKDKLPDAMWNADTALESNSRVINTVTELLQDPRGGFWDKPGTLDVRETRDDVLARAMQKGMKAGIKALGKDPGRWRWGAVHTALFRNQTFGKSGIPLVERIFNRGPVPVGGGMQQVASSDWRADKPFDTYSISSMRQIIDLSSFDASQAMNATGQSGHVGSGHYADMIRPWSLVRYHPTFWEDAALKSNGFQRLVLRPQ